MYIDNEEEHRKVREFLQLLGPQYLDRIEHYNGGRSLFHDYGIDAEIERLMNPKINLPSGGSIVIETTEALTVIDVNSGKVTGGKNLEDTIGKTNVEAAAEIARQVRLRDIGGIIVVDFIDMGSETARNKVLKTLEDGLRRDRTRATIQSFSNLGLLEFTRKRVGKDLAGQLRGTCPTCAGLGTVMSPQSVAIEALRHLRAHTVDDRHRHAVIEAAPSVAAQLEFWYEDECAQLAKDLGVTVHVRASAAIHPERTRTEFRAAAPTGDGRLRVGDEVEVQLLPGRLPNAASAAALVGDRIVEVENAANHSGNAAKIRILDIDDAEDYVVADLISAGAAAAADESGKRRRAGAGRAKKRRGPLSAAEQTAQLKELAAEAASSAQARPPIGITTITEEEEAADTALAAEVKGERSAAAIVIAEDGDIAAGTPESHEKRRRRRRGRRGRGRASGAAENIQPQAMPVAGAPHLADEDEEDELQPESIPPIGGVGTAAGVPGGEGGRRRRRRRGRRGRGGAGAGAPGVGAPVPDRSLFRVGSDGAAQPTGRIVPPEPSRAIARYSAPTPPAVEPPPPHLRAPQEEPQPTKPARARRPRVTKPAAEIPAISRAALPAPAAEAKPAPKRTAAKKAAAPKAAAAKKSATGAKKSPAKKTASTAKKAPAKKAGAKKSPAASGAKKKTSATAGRKKSS